jgi:hypothetical protein
MTEKEEKFYRIYITIARIYLVALIVFSALYLIYHNKPVVMRNEINYNLFNPETGERIK